MALAAKCIFRLKYKYKYTILIFLYKPKVLIMRNQIRI